MQKLNEKQVLVQNTKTGKQVILSKHFFERQKALKKNGFSDFEIVPSVSATTEKPKKSKEVTE
jgi:hypothetical protein